MYANRVKESTATAGIGPYSLNGAAAGYRTFVDGIGDGNSCVYCVENDTDWEVGIGSVTDGATDTLSRDTILDSSNAGAAVNWGIGEKTAHVTYPALLGQTQFVALSANPVLPNERVLVGTANRITVTDGGAGSNVTLSTPQDIATGSSVTFAGVTVSGLTASRLVASSGGSALASVTDLTSWIAGTTNQITVTDDADGTVTLAAPQDIAAGSSPTFTGLTLSGLTQGSVLFAGAGGVISQDNSNLFWDDTNDRLGIGTNSPGADVELNGLIPTLRFRDTDVTAGLDQVLGAIEFWSDDYSIDGQTAWSIEMVSRNTTASQVSLSFAWQGSSRAEIYSTGGMALRGFGGGISSGPISSMLYVEVGFAWNKTDPVAYIANFDTNDSFASGLLIEAGRNQANSYILHCIDSLDDGSALMVRGDGLVGINQSTPAGQLEINSATATTPGLIVQTTDDDVTEDILDIQNAAGTSLAHIKINAGGYGEISCPGAGTDSEAFGKGCTAAGNNAFAFGQGASADFAQSLAIGQSAQALSSGAVCVGRVALAGNNSVAIGNVASASGSVSTAVGEDTLCSASSGVAIGQGAESTHNYSVCIGRIAKSTAANQLVMGGWNTGRLADVYIGGGVTNTTPSSTTYNATGGSGTNIAGGDIIFAGGKGTGNAAGGDIIFQTSNAGASGTTLQSLTTKAIVKVSGNVGINETSPAAKLEINSATATTPGLIVQTTDDDVTEDILDIQNAAGTSLAHIKINASGYGEIDCPGSGASSSTFGVGATATGDNSFAFGANASASATSAFALGVNSSASAANNVALGTGASASGSGSMAMGGGASTASNDGVAIGVSATITDLRSTVIGRLATAERDGVAIGYNATALRYGIAIGGNATCTAFNQLVIGADVRYINDVYIGAGVTYATPQAVTINAGGASGTNIAGVDISLAGGKGTGNAAGGDILFKTSDAGVSGTTLQSLTTKAIVKVSGNVGINETSPAARLEINSATATTPGLIVQTTDDDATSSLLVCQASGGGSIGIQVLGDGKVGFFGATPVAKQTEITDELTTISHTAPGTPDYALQDLVDSGAGSAFGFASKDEGNTLLSVVANLQARVNELETALVNLGLLADAD